MLRSIIEYTNCVMGRLRARRRCKTPKEASPVCLNLGCGLAVTKGWINVDGSLNALFASLPRPLIKLVYRLTGAKQYYSEAEYCEVMSNHIFVHHDLSYGIPFNDETADYIFSSHFFEHLYRTQAISLMGECFRVLKKGGVLRISIPDLKYAISLYGQGRKDELLEKYFFVEHDGAHYSRHKYMYDYQMLSDILKEIGFSEIIECKYQEGKVPDIEILDNRSEESLFVEARK